MLSLLGLNLTISTSHHELSSGHMSQSTADELIAVIQNDFRKIGHRVTGQDPVQVFDSTRIVFFADLDDNGNVVRFDTMGGTGYEQAPESSWTKRANDTSPGCSRVR